MNQTKQPAIWLLVLLAGLGQFSETVYSPAIPSIVTFFQINNSWVEYTITTYLFSFGIGILFWGILSDYFGRRPCVITGLIIYVVGSFCCSLADSFWLLMISRFIQGLGASISSVLAQTICRDAYHGKNLSKAYATIGSATAIFPAIAPIVGGIITQEYNWAMIFIFLGISASFILAASIIMLPETLQKKHKKTSIANLFLSMRHLASDPTTIGCGVLLGCSNGISFSYFAEGPFLLINTLGLSPAKYGSTFWLLALATIAGGLISRKLTNRLNSGEIIKIGVRLTIASFMVLAAFSLLYGHFSITKEVMISLIVLSMMVTMAGKCMITANALAKALQHYKQNLGIASAIFGFFYYGLTTLITFIMGMLHNGTLIPMPLFFLGIGILMKLISKNLIKN